VTLAPGARIADALTAAGGALDRADLTGLNMARRVADGEQIVVGIAVLPGAPPVMGSSVSAGGEGEGRGGAAGPSGTGPPVDAAAKDPAKSDAPLDLNAATAEQLDDLPGVGPVTAAAIVQWRTANGRFANVDQLADVDGIGPARLDKLRNLVHV
jgi:competence protein ComEA